MARNDLSGKTVMLITTDPLLMGRQIESNLSYIGAQVVCPDLSANDVAGAEAIIRNVVGHEPPIDALIIHHSNIDSSSGLKAAVKIAKELKDTCPVLISNVCDKQLIKAALQNEGAKIISTFPNRAAAAVVDVIQNKGKTGMVLAAAGTAGSKVSE